jgi:hypothetical protein
LSTTIALTTGGSTGPLGVPAPVSKAGRPQQRKLEKAMLQLFQAKPNNEGATRGTPRGSIPFQFNPKELSITKAAKWGREPSRGAKKSGPVEFTGADPCKLTLEMFLDASDRQDGSVVAAVEKLLSCCVPTEVSLGKQKAMPPLVTLQWGDVSSFLGFITSVNVKYSRFAADGTPIRATCGISIEEMPGDEGGSPPRQNPTSGGRAVADVHTMIEGDTLASLAYLEYDDAASWRQLASYNGIDDPLRIPVGTTVLLPTPAELTSTGT